MKTMDDPGGRYSTLSARAKSINEIEKIIGCTKKFQSGIAKRYP